MVNSILRKDLEHSEETASKKYMGSWIAPWRFLRSDGFQRFMSGPVFSSLTKRLHWPPDIGPAVAACGRNIGNIWPILRNTVQSLAYKLTYISAIRRFEYASKSDNTQVSHLSPRSFLQKREQKLLFWLPPGCPHTLSKATLLRGVGCDCSVHLHRTSGRLHHEGLDESGECHIQN